jgi:hypothetical protein
MASDTSNKINCGRSAQLSFAKSKELRFSSSRTDTHHPPSNFEIDLLRRWINPTGHTVRQKRRRGLLVSSFSDFLRIPEFL